MGNYLSFVLEHLMGFPSVHLSIHPFLQYLQCKQNGSTVPLPLHVKWLLFCIKTRHYKLNHCFFNALVNFEMLSYFPSIALLSEQGKESVCVQNAHLSVFILLHLSICICKFQLQYISVHVVVYVLLLFLKISFFPVMH